MTFPPVVRVFFAIDLPATAKEQVGRFISQIKRRAKPHTIRWSKPDNLHVTLQFLAEVRSTDLSTLLTHVRQKLVTDLNEINLSFGAVQLLPSPFRPRVLVLDVAPQPMLKTLSGLVGEGILAAGYPIEERPFRGHLTIGRIKQPHGLDLSFISEFTSPPVDPIVVKDIALFRSEPRPEGSQYMVLERIHLATKAKAS